jgi:hypothetical protein
MNAWMYLQYDNPCHNCESWRFPSLRLLTRCTRALEGGGYTEELHGSEGGLISWVVQFGRINLMNFRLL